MKQSSPESKVPMESPVQPGEKVSPNYGKCPDKILKESMDKTKLDERMAYLSK